MTALYRTRRPKTFSSVVGQVHVVTALKNQIAANAISHAYLFCGTRGTGKTSAARIFARAVNCLTPDNGGEPCNTCEACVSILAERSLDVIEIDAASNNGVDNIRDLREEVLYPPRDCRRKVYIIDEVHMLTGSAFNALLKTLEEPPAHAVFILATTDPQKVPATVQSRCQRYDFKRISPSEIIKSLKECLAENGTAFDERALDYIAYHSDGAMRDALSLLDQCLSFGSESLTLETVLDLMGAVDRQVLFAFTDALGEYDTTRAIEIINDAMKKGRDVSQFAADLIRHFRDVLVAGFVTEQSVLDVAADVFENLQAQSKRIKSERLTGLIYLYAEAMREMRFVAHPRTVLEVVTLRAMAGEGASASNSSQSSSDEIIQSLQARLARLEEKIEAGVVAVAPSQKSEDVAIANASPAEKSPQINSPPPVETPPVASFTPPPAETPSLAGGDILVKIKQNWQGICQKTSYPLKSMLPKCSIDISNGALMIVCESDTTATTIRNRQSQIEDIIMKQFGESVTITVAIGKSGVASNSSATPPAETPPTKAAADDDWSAFGEQVQAGEDENPW